MITVNIVCEDDEFEDAARLGSLLGYVERLARAEMKVFLYRSNDRSLTRPQLKLLAKQGGWTIGEDKIDELYLIATKRMPRQSA